MKKLFIGLLILNMTVLAYGAIVVNDAENKIIQIVVQSSELAVSTATRLGTLTQQGTDIVTSVGTNLDTTDKQKLAAYQALLITAKDALDAVVAYKDAQWSDL